MQDASVVENSELLSIANRACLAANLLILSSFRINHLGLNGAEAKYYTTDIVRLSKHDYLSGQG